MNVLDNMAVRMQIRMWKCKENIKSFFAEEHGVSNVVATIILVLIVVLIIGVFWKQLSTWLKGMMDKIFGTTFDDSGLGGTP